MQAVHPRYRLDQVVTLQRLVDVQHRVTRLIETCEQLVDDDEQIRRAIGAKVTNDLFLVGFRVVAASGHGLLPPLLDLGQRVLIDFRVSLARVGCRDHDRARHQTRLIQRLLVADRIEFAVGRHLALKT